MERRRFLAAFGAVTASGFAGCAAVAPGVGTSAGPRKRGPGASSGGDGAGTTGVAENGSTATAGSDHSLARSGFPAEICEESVQDDPGIYAITDPVFAPDWRDLRVASRYVGGEHDGTVAPRPGGLPADATVVGLEAGGEARAYPISVLWTHEAVNDTVGDVPLLVTYCSLCRSGMVAERRVAGTVTTFRVSGLLWQAPQIQAAAAEQEGRVFGAVQRGGEAVEIRHSGNVVIVDDVTGSYWSQILARAICGPQEGTVLDQVPASLATWEEWQGSHPGTEVLLPPPHSGTTRRT